MRRLNEQDVVLAADALADAKDPGTAGFPEVAGEIVGTLKHLVDEDSDRRQAAADGLATVGRWGASEYLVERARADGQPEVSLAALLAARSPASSVLAGATTARRCHLPLPADGREDGEMVVLQREF